MHICILAYYSAEMRFASWDSGFKNRQEQVKLQPLSLEISEHEQLRLEL